MANYMYMSSKVLVFASVIIGLILVVMAGVYFLESARSLPHYFPGYSPLLTKHHYTHAVGTLVLGLLAFVFAWFQSGKKSTK
ncbi:MAG: hypothetical protein ACREGI_00645 [Candidatus Levyibacteriota bacterium]